MSDNDRQIPIEGEILKPYDVGRHDGDGNTIGESLGRFDTEAEAFAFRSKQRKDWHVGVFYKRKMLPLPPRKA